MKSMPYYFMSDGGVHGHQRCHTVAPAHAHNNLLRWVGVAVFGLSHTLLVTGRRMDGYHSWKLVVLDLEASRD